MDTRAILHNYTYVFDFENEFVHQKTRTWMQDNWTVGFYLVGLYVLFIFLGQRWMKPKARFELRGPLTAWNMLLALFSIVGACRTVPELIHTLRYHGIYNTICLRAYIEDDKVSGFWTWLFVLSKVPELGDTVFIVLRKQPLIFLHWYHHATVLLYSWFSYTEYTASARWFVTMNYCVHSLMYGYYALRSMGFKPPRRIAMLITTLQLSQMVMGCYVNLLAGQYLDKGAVCHTTPLNIKLSLCMYFSYFVLFARFFYKAHMLGGARQKRKAA
ncbi:elongation of very long chain fatty acids protein 6-like [Cylas formicarius]|uniref:elongation of very long chain fatty acids protein 6-like n=1 Tax=Cylas formicarius TaxID=197179 RepID=UPI002958D601|nr:elongation of very long chain fatty acids protein 6-like [Cylas formicarius]